MRNHKKTTRLLLVIALVVLVGGATYAFTASNTVPGSKAGEGTGGITGYTVSNIHYTIDNSDATLLSSVDFDLSAAANDVKITLTNGGTVFDCGPAGAGPTFSVSCAVSGVPASINPADNLTVVAVS
jgi:hypothetical protein